MCNAIKILACSYFRQKGSFHEVRPSINLEKMGDYGQSLKMQDPNSVINPLFSFYSIVNMSSPIQSLKYVRTLRLKLVISVVRNSITYRIHGQIP